MLRPFGQVSEVRRPCRARERPPTAPATRMHDWIPWHSFVAEPAGANAAAAASAATNATQRDPHGILRNHSPESRPPASTNASPPPAAAALTSTVFLRLPVRDPSSS